MGLRRNPVGVVDLSVHLPRVARSSQPWAGGRNPFGIEHPCKVRAEAAEDGSTPITLPPAVTDRLQD